MAGLTLEQAETKLNEWLAVDVELQTGQTAKFGERSLTRADAMEVRNNIDYWHKKCHELNAAENGGGRSRTVSPSW